MVISRKVENFHDVMHHNPEEYSPAKYPLLSRQVLFLPDSILAKCSSQKE